MKAKIIDAGIQGKLTDILPEDEIAEELFGKIQNEKAELIKLKKIKHRLPLCLQVSGVQERHIILWDIIS